MNKEVNFFLKKRKSFNKEKKKLKILVASDLHGDVSAVEKLVKKAKKEKVDLVVLCGDITYFGEGLEGMIGPFKKINKKVLIVPGNHENVATTDFLVQLYTPGVYNLHGYSIKFKDVGFFGIGSDNSLTINSKHLEDILNKSYERIKDSKHKILIAHFSPVTRKTKALGMMEWEENKIITKIVKKFKPDFVFCGHIHEFEGLEDKLGKTKIKNVGKHGEIIEI